MKEILKSKSINLMAKIKTIVSSYENGDGILDTAKLEDLKEGISLYINETSNN